MSRSSYPVSNASFWYQYRPDFIEQLFALRFARLDRFRVTLQSPVSIPPEAHIFLLHDSRTSFQLLCRDVEAAVKKYPPNAKETTAKYSGQ